ncbi:MAG: hypothetical protein JXB32_13010 [Deltaproteobacteria bacterium]|nr:hypothetical protein [Deltaproteobacteria bacterium]
MKACLALVLASGLLAFGAGCQDDWQSFFIQDNKRLGEPPGCEIPRESSAAGLVAGLLDLSVSSSYAGYLYVENGLIARADPGLPRAESNGIFVRGAYLYFEPDPACGAGALPDMEIRFSNFILPQGSATIGIYLIPEVLGAGLRTALAGCPDQRAQITVTVQVFGVTQAGTEMETQEFDFPITLCDGCLVYCPTGVDLDTTTPGCQCNCNSDVEQEDPPCHPGQDDYVDCRYVYCAD